MSTTKLRQRNYRLRKELEMWINVYFAKIKKQSPHDIITLKKHLEELEKLTKEYIALNQRKDKA